jgi:hypothetical protein
MTYKDLGYSKLLVRGNSVITQEELTEDKSSQIIAQLTGTNIITGMVKSSDGRMVIDLDKGQILINDGAYNRVLIGFDIN